MAISDKLNYLNNTKELIKEVLENNGITVGEIPFREYPNLLKEFLKPDYVFLTIDAYKSLVVNNTVDVNLIYHILEE